MLLSLMYEDVYQKVSEWVRSRPVFYKCFRLLYTILPICVVITYGMMLVGSFVLDRGRTLRLMLVPAGTFLVTTLFRKVVNAPRPYEKYRISPLIPRDKKGESFPSRHMVSVTIIAMGGWYLHWKIGLFLSVLAVLIGILRPLAGVHFIHDVVAAAAFAVLCGVLGFYL